MTTTPAGGAPAGLAGSAPVEPASRVAETAPGGTATARPATGNDPAR